MMGVVGVTGYHCSDTLTCHPSGNVNRVGQIDRIIGDSLPKIPYVHTWFWPTLNMNIVILQLKESLNSIA